MTITIENNTVTYDSSEFTIICSGKDGYIHRIGELVDDLRALGIEAFSDGDEFEEFRFTVYRK